MSGKLRAKDDLEIVFANCRNRTKSGDLYVAFFDGNKMKQVNDTHGHLMGDFVIERLTSLITRNSRDDDVLIRFGGDEFVLFLPDFPFKDVRPWITRIQESITNDPVLLKKIGGMTASVGVVKFDPTIHKNLMGVLESADKLMYKAKKDKKSQYCAFDDDPEPIRKSARKGSTSAIRRRELFDWVHKMISTENPDFIDELLSLVIRNYWKQKMY